MFLQYGELRPITGWDRFFSLRHLSKFQRISRLAFVTAATSLTGGQPNFARCLAVSWPGTLYIHFRGLLTPDAILQILAAVLHGTPAAGVSQTLERGTRNGITELLQRAPPSSAVWPSRWTLSHILVIVMFIYGWSAISLHCFSLP